MERMKSRFGWALAGALGIILVLALGRATLAGPLDPPGPVGSTMRTIDELLPSWGKTLSSTGGCTSQRFACVLPTGTNPTGEAVLDHETGLVWQRVPAAGSIDFLTADQTCREAKIGGRYGWRLPTINELLSLDDDTTADSLPAGHPFTNAPDTYLWSQTADATDAQRVQTMTFLLNGGGFSVIARARFGFNPADNARPWCVRGESDASAQQPAEQPAWARKLDAIGGCNSARFTCVLPTAADPTGEAVLDHSTGLVWQKSIGTDTATFSVAQIDCAGTSTGGISGWRVPTLSELYTLLDPTRNSPSFSGPALPVGHPFLDVPVTGNHIWSTTDITGTTNAWAMRYGNWPAQPSETQITGMSTAAYVFCVRSHQ